MSAPAPAAAASPTRAVTAATGALAVAIDLLCESARATGADLRPGGRIDIEAAALLPRLPRLGGAEGLDELHRALADCALIAREIAHLAEFLASADRRPCPLALAAARLAETATQMVVEAVADEGAPSGVEALSRRARQVVEIHEIENQLDTAVARLAARGIRGSLERRTFRHSSAPRLTDADWDP
jgi:hypothetical protein